MSKVPVASKEKELPTGILDDKQNPQDIELDKNAPAETELEKEQPVETPKLEIVPDVSPQTETIPDVSPDKTEMPSDYIEENCITVDGKIKEIKPTKLKYFRNKAASAYGLLKAVPLHEFLIYGKGVFDEQRDADQLLYDFLVSVFDDMEFVRDNYNDMDAEQVDRALKIFSRLNHVEEREEQARKNREAQAQAKR